MAIGHPNGYRKGRTPVVRLGRVLNNSSGAIRTDCTLVGGDSGGPLFDMYGRVIGIHSRIGRRIVDNIHVPVNTYKETWARLTKGEIWGSKLGGPRAYMGLKLDFSDKSCRVTEVSKDSPAAKAGLKTDDVLLKFDGKNVTSMRALVGLLSRKRPNDRVELEIRRGEETKNLSMRLGRRPS